MKAGSERTHGGGGHGPEGAKKTRGFSEVFRIFGCDSWQRHLSDGEKRKTFRLSRVKSGVFYLRSHTDTDSRPPLGLSSKYLTL